MAKINTAVFPLAVLEPDFCRRPKRCQRNATNHRQALIEFVVEERAAIERLVLQGRQKHAVENRFDHMIELESTLAERGKKDAAVSVNEMLGLPGEVIFIQQMRPLGLGHAVWAARHGAE